MERTLATKPGVSAPAWRNLVAAVAAIAIFGFALGLMFPLLSLILAERGFSDVRKNKDYGGIERVVSGVL